MDRAAWVTVVVLGLAACAALPGGGVAAEAVELTCTEEGTVASVASVRPQPDGIHVRVENLTGEGVAVYREDDWSPYPVPPPGGEFVLAEGQGRFVLELDPPLLRLACSPGPYPQQGDPWVEVRVEDPELLWVSPELGCPESEQMTWVSDLAEGTEGYQGDPVEAARMVLQGLVPEDTVERAGYPERGALVRVVREGMVVATLSFTDDGGGGWLPVVWSVCEGTDIG